MASTSREARSWDGNRPALVFCALPLTVSVDHRLLVDWLVGLIKNNDLRRTFGQAGKERALREFYWDIVYQRYHALWAELAQIRQSAAKNERRSMHLAAAPKWDAGRMDPFETFGHYATACVGPTTRLTLVPGAIPAAYIALADNALFAFARAPLPPATLVDKLFGALAAGQQNVAALVSKTEGSPGQMIILLAVLAKMGFIRFDAD